MPDALQMPTMLPESSPATAAYGYATEEPTVGEAAGAMFKTGVPAEERGLAIENAQPESDENRRWADSMLNPQMGMFGAPAPMPTAPAAPPGLPTAPPPGRPQRILTAPMEKTEAVKWWPNLSEVSGGTQPAEVWRLQSEARTEEVEIADTLGRFSMYHAWPVTGALQIAVGLLDPRNLAAGLVPGIGEEAIMAGILRTGLRSTLMTRTAARALAGATAMTTAQIPLTMMQQTLAEQEGTDFSIRDSISQMAMWAGVGAVLHAGFGAGLRETGILAPDAAKRATREAATVARETAPLLPSEDETIAGAGALVNGKMYTGRTHYEALEKASAETGKDLNDIFARMAGEPGFDAEGFVTSTGRYVNRAEAVQIAHRADQIAQVGTLSLEASRELVLGTNELFAEQLKKPEEPPALPQAVPAELAAILNATAVERDAAIRAAASAAWEGRPIDVLPTMAAGRQRLMAETSMTPIDVAARQAQLYREGFVPSMSQAELEAAAREIYGPKVEGAAPGVAAPAFAAPRTVSSGAGVAAAVREQAIAAGRPVEEADLIGRIWGANYATRAAQLGTTAEELFRNESVGIQAGAPAVTRETQPQTPARAAGKVKSLAQFLAERGGVKDEQGEMSAIAAQEWHRQKPFRRKLVNPDGMDPDYAREAAEEAGYLMPGSTMRDFYDAIDREMRGRPVHVPGEEPEVIRPYDHDRLVHDIAALGEDASEWSRRQIEEFLSAHAAAADLDWAAQALDHEIEGRAPDLLRGLEDATIRADAAEEIPFEPVARPAGEAGAAPGAGEGERPGHPAEDEGAVREGERGAPAGAEVPPVEGAQAVIPGAGRISDRELAERRMAEPLRPGVAQKPAEEGLFDVGARGQKELFQPAAPAGPVFYSQLTRTAEHVAQSKGTPEQWLAMLRKGAKPEEIAWSGLEDWLREQKGTVTREALLDYLRANELQVSEVMRGGAIPQEALDNVQHWLDEKYGTADDQSDIDMAAVARGDSEAIGALEGWGVPAELLQPLYDNMGEGATKFGTYVLPGGTNYREMLITLPSEGLRGREAVFAKYAGRIETASEAWRFASRHGDNEEAARAIQERSRLITARDAEADTVAPAEQVAYRSPHWDEPNVVAHIRMNDRNDADGKRTLHVEEVQSDWHQKGRKEGYRGADATEADAQKFFGISDDNWAHATPADRAAYLREMLESPIYKRQLVPDAPFKTTWAELAMKRVLRYASENGYDKVTWTPGEKQAERYDLSKQVRQISWQGDGENDRIVTIAPHAGNDIEFRVGADGTIGPISQLRAGGAGEFDGKHITDVIGKDIGDKIVAERHGDLSGGGLRVGGEGMRGFYDKILPAKVNALVKKWGAKVGETRIKTGDDYVVEDDEGSSVHFIDRHDAEEYAEEHHGEVIEPGEYDVTVASVDITPAMRESVMQGQPLFQQGERGPRGSIRIEPTQRLITLFKTADASTLLHETGHLFLDNLGRDAEHPNATPQMKADLDTTLDWLRAKSVAEITDGQHEQFARGFEAYVAEGKAPTPELAGVFERFKQWLLQIYHSVAGLNVELSPAIREVFDRMLATEEEMRAARQGVSGAEEARPSGLREHAGWKLHLNVAGPAAEEINAYLKGLGVPHKVGHAGDQIGKGMTVYVGARNAAQRVAEDLDKRFGNILGKAEGDVLNDDTQLSGDVWGRFDAAGDRDFHQYGRAGVPFLNEDVGQFQFAPDREAAIGAAEARGDAELRKRYGGFYTGEAAPKVDPEIALAERAFQEATAGHDLLPEEQELLDASAAQYAEAERVFQEATAGQPGQAAAPEGGEARVYEQAAKASTPQELLVAEKRLADAKASRLLVLKDAARRAAQMDYIAARGGIGAAKDSMLSTLVLHYGEGLWGKIQRIGPYLRGEPLPPEVRTSFDNVQTDWRSQHWRVMGPLDAILRREGLEKLAYSDALRPEIAVAWGRLQARASKNVEAGDWKNTNPEIKPSKEAARIAELFHQATSHTAERLRAEGVPIGDANDYVTRSNWNSHQMRWFAGKGSTPDESFAAWWTFMKPLWNVEKTFADLEAKPGESTEAAQTRFARGMWEGRATGVVLQKPGTSPSLVADMDYLPPVYEGTHNLARAESQPRTVFWNSANDWQVGMLRSGGGQSLYQMVDQTVSRQARRLALIKQWGFNPEGNMNLVVRKVQQQYRADVDAVVKFQSQAKLLERVMGRLTGRLNIPASADGAALTEMLQQWEYTSKLGGVLPVHIGAGPLTVSSAMAHVGVSRLNAIGGLVKALLSGRSGLRLMDIDPETQLAIQQAGGYAHGIQIALHQFRPVDSGLPGYANWLTSRFMQMTGLTSGIDRLQSAGVKAMTMAHFGGQVAKEFSALGPEEAHVWQRYRMSPADWDLFRTAPDPIVNGDGVRYMTPGDALRTDPVRIADMLLRDRGLLPGSVTPDAMAMDVQKYQWGLADKLGMLLQDTADTGTVTPGAYEQGRALTLGNAQPGSIDYALRRMVLTFKMWPLAAFNQIINREIGMSLSGAKTARNFFWIVALSAAGGALTRTVKNAIYGRPQDDYTNWRTLLAAFAQGGGLGIYGDFLFGEANRVGAGLGSTLVGPIASDAELLYKVLYARVQQDLAGDHPEKAFQHMWPDLVHFGVNHIPFGNLIYIKGTLDYLVWFHLFEAMSPGWWQRTNQRRMREQGNTYPGYMPGAPIPYTQFGQRMARH